MEAFEDTINPRVFSVARFRVAGGVEVVAFARSARGTRYRYNSVVVLRGEKSKVEFAASLALATQQMLQT